MSSAAASLPEAGADPASEVGRTGKAVRHEIVKLVRERRYEEALSLLYAARAESPEDRDLLASIQQIKEFLVGSYAKRLGGLDRVAGPVPSGAPRFPDALLVARYVDGVSTFDDIRRSCPLGQLRTLQVLVALYTGSPTSVPPSLGETPPPPAVRALPIDPSSSADHAVPETKRTLVAPAHEMPTSEVRPVAPDDEPRPSWVAPAPFESPEDIAFRAAFTKGTAAFVQRRFQDAIDAFRECERLRPADNAAATMLRRAMKDAQSA